MSKILAGIAALSIMGAAALPLQANAADHGTKFQSSEVSSQRHWRGNRYHARRYYAPRRFYGSRRYYGGPRYGYYGNGYPYGYSYGYRPGVAFGFGPFGFRVF